MSENGYIVCGKPSIKLCHNCIDTSDSIQKKIQKVFDDIEGFMPHWAGTVNYEELKSKHLPNLKGGKQDDKTKSK